MPNSSPPVALVGFSEAATIAVEQLLAMGYDGETLRVLTNPDGDHPSESNASLLALLEARDIPYSTASVRDLGTQDWLLDSNPEALFCMYYFEKIPADLLEQVPRGGVNCHPAPLPEYRGTLSSMHAINNGENRFGFAYHYMTSNFDDGRIILQRPVSIHETDTAQSLYYRTRHAAASHFRRVHEAVMRGYPGDPQDEEQAQYYPKELPNGGEIDPDWRLSKIARFIRALYFPPHDPAWIKLDGEKHFVRSMTAFRALIESDARPTTKSLGDFHTDNGGDRQ